VGACSLPHCSYPPGARGCGDDPRPRSELEMLASVVEWLKKPVEPDNLVKACVWDRVSRWLAAYRDAKDAYPHDLGCAFDLAQQYEALVGTSRDT
jgi:hypothetical protein